MCIAKISSAIVLRICLIQDSLFIKNHRYDNCSWDNVIDTVKVAVKILYLTYAAI